MSEALILSDFERAAMNALLAGEHPVLAALRHQLEVARVRDRRMSGAGFFLDFEVDEAAPRAPTTKARVDIGDVDASVPGLDPGCGFVLAVENGYLRTLTCYCYEQALPDRIEGFQIRYRSGPDRNLKTLAEQL